MSNAAVAWAKRTRVGGPINKAVLLCLADYADADGSCFPGQDRIAGEVEISTRRLRDHLVELENAGLITRQRRVTRYGHRTSDGYRLQMSLPDDPSGGLPDAGSHPYRTPASEEPSGEPSENPPNPPHAGGTENPSRCTRHRRRRSGCPDCELPPLAPIPDRCGDCDPNRWLVDTAGRPYAKCPTCHPSVVRPA